MRIYSVQLEGTEASHGYFINIEAAAFTADQASSLALKAGLEMGLKIKQIEEIVETNQRPAVGHPQVLSVSGKSYFPAEE